MWNRYLLLVVLLLAACATPSPYQNLPPECQDSSLAKATGGIFGRTNMAACRAAVDRQGGPMSIMKSPEQLQQEYGARRPQRQQQDMPPMTPEQYQQTQQMMQQMQPMMQQMQPMMPRGQMPTGQPQPMQPTTTDADGDDARGSDADGSAGHITVRTTTDAARRTANDAGAAGTLAATDAAANTTATT